MNENKLFKPITVLIALMIIGVFTTVLQAQVVLREDFSTVLESGVPDGWTVDGTNYKNWKLFGDDITAPKCFCVPTVSDFSKELISPEFSLDAEEYYLYFDFKFPYDYSTVLTVYISEDGGENYDILEYFSGSDSEGHWREQEVDLSDYSGKSNLKLKFEVKCRRGVDYVLYIDNIAIGRKRTTSCPQDLEINYADHNSAIIEWGDYYASPNAICYTITVDDEDGNRILNNVAVTLEQDVYSGKYKYDITGLRGSTKYNVYLRSVYGPLFQDTSIQSTTMTFTTFATPMVIAEGDEFYEDFERLKYSDESYNFYNRDNEKVLDKWELRDQWGTEKDIERPGNCIEMNLLSGSNCINARSIVALPPVDISEGEYYFSLDWMFGETTETLRITSDWNYFTSATFIVYVAREKFDDYTGNKYEYIDTLSSFLHKQNMWSRTEFKLGDYGENNDRVVLLFEGLGSTCNYKVRIDNVKLKRVSSADKYPVCLHLSDTAIHSVTLDWMMADSVVPTSFTAYMVDEWGDVVVNNQRIVATESNDTFSYTFDRLEENRKYTVKLKANHADGSSSSWGEEITFLTAPELLSVPYREDFDSLGYIKIRPWEFTYQPIYRHTAMEHLEVNKGSSKTGVEKDNHYLSTQYRAGEFIMPTFSPDVYGKQLRFRASKAWDYGYYSTLNISAFEDSLSESRDLYSGHNILEHKTRRENQWIEKVCYVKDENTYSNSMNGEKINLRFYTSNVFKIDDIVIQDIPACPEPGNLRWDIRSAGGDSVCVLWQAGRDDLDLWKVRILHENNIIREFFVDTNFVSISNLKPHVTYTVEVKTICDNTSEDEGWMSTEPFTMSCDYMYVGQTESFYTTERASYELYFSDLCWDDERVGTSTSCRWDINNDYEAYINTKVSAYSDTTKAYLYSPMIDLRDETSASMIFDSRIGSTASDLRVMVSTDFGASYNDVVANITDKYSVTKTDTINLDAYAGQIIKVKFATTCVPIDSYNASSNYIYIDNVGFINTIVCPSIDSVEISNITNNSMSLNIFDDSDNIRWEVACVLPGLRYNDTANVIQITTNKSVTINGLKSGRTYELRVSPICGDNNKVKQNNVGMFTTNCAMAQVPYFDGFEDYYDAAGLARCSDFINFNSEIVIETNNYDSYDGNKNMNVQYRFGESNGFAYYVLPQIDANIEDLKISFFYKFLNLDSKLFEVGLLPLSLDTAQFIKLQEFNSADGYTEAIAYFEHLNLTNNDYRIAIKALLDQSTSVNVDNLKVEINTDCVSPLRTEVVNTTTTTATVDIIDQTDNTAWEIAYGQYGAPFDEMTIVSTNQRQVVLEGLNPQNIYEVYARTVCGDKTSIWTRKERFNTECVEARTITLDNPYFEDFEQYDEYELPLCWTLVAHDEYDRTGISSKRIILDTYSFMALPKFTNPLNTLMMRFDFNMNDHGNLAVGYTTDFENVIEVEHFYVGEEGDSLIVDFTLIEDVPEDAHIVIKSNTGYYAYFDNVEIFIAPECMNPRLVSSESNASKIKIDYVSAPDVTRVEYKVNKVVNYEDDNGDYQSYEVEVKRAWTSENPFIIGGLEADTDYMIYLRSECYDGEDTTLLDWGEGHNQFTYTHPPVLSPNLYASGGADCFTVTWKMLQNDGYLPSSYKLWLDGAEGIDTVYTRGNMHRFQNLNNGDSLVLKFIGLSEDEFRSSPTDTISLPFVVGINTVMHDDFENFYENQEWITGEEVYGKNMWQTPYQPIDFAIDGVSALYIGDLYEDTTVYDPTQATVSIAAHPINVTGGGTYNISFDFKGVGEPGKDFARAFIAPNYAGLPYNIINKNDTSLIPIDGGVELSGKNESVTISSTVTIPVDTNLLPLDPYDPYASKYYIVFYWENDNTGSATSGAMIDNVHITQDGMSDCDVNIPTVELHARVCRYEPFFFMDNMIETYMYEPNVPHVFEEFIPAVTAEQSDSIYRLYLTIESFDTTINASICQGESYVFNGEECTSSGYYYAYLNSVYGCDSIVTLNLNVVDKIEAYLIDTMVCGGDSFEWNGQTIASSGTYSDTTISAMGCDSITYFNVTFAEIEIPAPFDTTICEGESIYYLSGEYSATGTYDVPVVNEFACPASAVLNLTVIPKYYNTSVTINEGETYEWEGEMYITAGYYEAAYVNANGCDSIRTLTLETIQLIEIHKDSTICEGKCVAFMDTTVCTTGDYIHHDLESNIKNVLHLTVTPIDTTNVDINICDGDSIQFFGTTYREAGTYTYVEESEMDCDVVHTMNLIVNPVTQDVRDTAICSGSSVDFFGQILTEAGEYSQMIAADSINCVNHVLNLSFIEPIETVIDTVACQGVNLDVTATSRYAAFVLDGKSYYESGIYRDTLVASTGCDSIVTLNLTLLKPVLEYIQTSICAGGEYIFGNSVLTEEGEYSETFVAANGCDSVVTVYLQVDDPLTSFFFEEIYEGDSVVVGGIAYKETGRYIDTLKTSGGCDSIVNFSISVLPSYDVTIDTTLCDGSCFGFYGQAYCETGTYTYEQEDTARTTYTINVTVVAPIETVIDTVACQGISDDVTGASRYAAFVLDGKSYYQSGEYRDTLVSSTGCDSIRILNLTLLQSSITYLQTSICAGGTYLFGDRQLTFEGEYSDTLVAANGCDSVVTVYVDVLDAIDTTFITHAMCEGDTYQFGGDELSEIGIYYDIQTGVNGCDSVIVLALGVYPPNDTTIYATICYNDYFEYEGYKFTTTGTHVFEIPDLAGCKINVTLHLNILDDIIVNDTVTIKNGTTYSFGQQNLTEAGDYTEVFKNIIGCDSTVHLHLIVDMNTAINNAYSNVELVIAPNPVDAYSEVTLKFSDASIISEIDNIEIIDNTGKIIDRIYYKENVDIDNITISAPRSNGVYYIRVITKDDGVIIGKLIVK